MDLKLKDLRYLVAVADQRHFGRAAARCFVSQPTLSAQLKKLEQYLGVQLIERAPNNVSLTAAGAEIVARARRILEASDEMVALARSQRDPLAGRLRGRAAADDRPLPAAARSAGDAQGAAAPGAAAVRVPDGADAGEAARRRAGSRHPGAAGGARRARVARAVPRALHASRCPSSTRWPRHDSVRVADLKGETLLLLEDGHCLRDQALEVCSRVGARETQDFRATSLETLRQMVAAGAGITLLPELAGRGAYRNARGVVLRPFARPAPARCIGARVAQEHGARAPRSTPSPA